MKSIKANQYLDIEYHDTGVLIRRPNADTVDESAKLAREVRRTVRDKSPVRIQKDGYDPYPLATASENSPPREILKSHKRPDKTKFNDSAKPAKRRNSSRHDKNSRNKSRPKVSWHVHLTQHIRPLHWIKRCNKRIPVQWPLSSNEGSLHEFPASLTPGIAKGCYPFIHRGINFARNSVSSEERAWRDAEQEEEAKKENSWSADLRNWWELERSSETRVGVDGAAHPRESIETLGPESELEESDHIEDVAVTPEKRSVQRDSRMDGRIYEAVPETKQKVSEAVQRRRVARGTRVKLTRTDKYLTDERKASWGQ